MPTKIMYEAYKILESIKAKIDACPSISGIEEIRAKYSGLNLNNDLGKLKKLIENYPDPIRHSLSTIIEENRAIILHACEEKLIALQNPGSTV